MVNKSAVGRTLMLFGAIAAAAAAALVPVRAEWNPNEWTAVEKENVKVVSEMLRAWEQKDGATIERLLEPDGTTRLTAVTPAPPRNAKETREVAERSFTRSTIKFTVLHTVAQGPVVVIRRNDRFTDKDSSHCAWHGLKEVTSCEDQYMAVFVVKDGKIKEWLDYEVAPSKPIRAQ